MSIPVSPNFHALVNAASTAKHTPLHRANANEQGITGMSILQLAPPVKRMNADHAVKQEYDATQSNDDSNDSSKQLSDEQKESMDDDDDDDEEMDDSCSSQSCPSSPLQSLAALSSFPSHGLPPLPNGSPHGHAHVSRRRSVDDPHGAIMGRHAHKDAMKKPRIQLIAAPGFKKRSSSGSESGSAGGSSCHQCKSRRSYGDLTYCTSSLNKKNKNSMCRKKYCEHCLKKFYREMPPSSTMAMWRCPACRHICCCAACRRREMREADDGELGGPTPMPTPMHAAVEHAHTSSVSPSPPPMQKLMLSPAFSPISSKQSSGLSLSATKPSHHASTLSTPISKHSTSHSHSHSQSLSPSSSSHSSHSSSSPSPPSDTSDPLDTAAVALSGLVKAALPTPISPSNIKHSMTVSLHHNDGHALASSNHATSSSALDHVALPSTHTFSSPSPHISHSTGLSLSSVMLTPRTRGITSSSSFLHSNLSATISNMSMHIKDEKADYDRASHAAEAASSLLNKFDAASDDADADDSHENDSGELESNTPSFALFYALSCMPAVQSQVKSILTRVEVKNAEKLKLIENVFNEAAEKVMNEVMPLQL